MTEPQFESLALWVLLMLILMVPLLLELTGVLE
jgi:hypothetical protein